MKNNIKLLSCVVAAMLTVSAPGLAYEYSAEQISGLSQMKKASIKNLDNDTRVFAVDKNIETLMVRFENHFGFEVAGHLYLPAGFKSVQKYPAIVITGPFGAVKEQSSGLYAQELAKRGFVTLAFDPSTTGESSGSRRNVGSPEIFTEDVSAAVDFISHLDFVNPDAIGGLGICGLAGMVVTAASNDPRIKAVVTSAMYDMSESISDHYQGAYYTDEQRNLVKKHLAHMRDEEAVTGKSIRGAHELGVDKNGQIQTFDVMFPDTLPKGADPVTTEFYNYYVGRAYHPRAINSNTSAWDSTTAYGFFNFKLMENITEISPRPLLLITGSKAHSKYFSDDVYAKAATPKQLIVVNGATHTDLYDRMNMIPFDSIESFFRNHLK